MRPTVRGVARDRERTARRTGLAIFALGVAIAAIGSNDSLAAAVTPNGVSGRLICLLFAAVLCWGGLVMWARNREPARKRMTLGGDRSQRHPRRRGQASGRVVPLTFAPNVPIAEMLCAQLRANGIEAVYNSAGVAGPTPGLASLNPALPVEVWVDEADLDEARQFLP